MSTLPALGLAPLSGIITAGVLGVFLDWLLIVAFVVTLGSLLPVILASIRAEAQGSNGQPFGRALA